MLLGSILISDLKASRADKSVKFEEERAKLTIHECSNSTPMRETVKSLPISILWGCAICLDLPMGEQPMSTLGS